MNRWGLRPDERRALDPSPSDLGSWPSFWAGAAAVAVVVTLLAVALLAPVPAPAKQVMSDVAFVLGSLAATLACLWRTRQHAGDRRGWTLLAAASGCWLVGNLFWFCYQLVLASQPFPSWSDPFYLAFIVLATAGLLALAPPSASRTGRIRTLIDGILITASLIFLSWTLVLQGAITASGLSPLARAVFIAYPVGDVVIASLALLLVVRAPRGQRLPFVCLGLGLVSYAVADSGYAYLSNRGTFRIGTILDVGWVAGYLLVALAAIAPHRARIDVDEPRTVAGAAVGLLPLVVAVVVAAGADVTGEPVLVITGAVVLTTFVARHLVMLHENARLNARLSSLVDTRTRALAQVTTRSESILNSVADGIYGIDLDGRVVFANPAALDVLATTDEALVGRRDHDTFHHHHGDTDGTRPGCPVHAAVASRSAQGGADEVYVAGDGRTFPVEYVATPLIEGGTVTGAVVAFRDITERQAVERMKEEFISIVSHELRTPLTSIRGSLGLLATGALGAIPETGARMLQIAVDSSDRLIRLVNDILDLERIRSGRFEAKVERCDVAEVAREAIDLLEPVAADATVELATSGPATWVWADPDGLAQTLTNLVGNAVKFSPPGSTVRVTHEVGGGADVVVSVVDEGRGVPEELRELVFAPFQQVGASDARTKGGTGLGLAISRSIVESHGGRIWIDDGEGGGAAFRFTLPSAEEVDRATAAAG